MSVILAVSILLGLLVLGVPIGAAAGVAGLAGFLTSTSLKATLSVFASVPFSTVTTYTFTVVPLFIVMGYLAFHAGLTEKAFFAAHKWFGRIPGGLAIAVIAACAAFAACSGSSLAAVSAMGKVSLPELRRYNYDDKLSLGAISVGGTLAVLIPPSLLLVIYGAFTQTPVGKLLIAGILPGILSAVLLSALIAVRCGLNPKLGPPVRGITWPERWSSLKGGVWGVLLLFFLVIGGLYVGVFTPTEAGAIGAFGAFVLAIAMRGGVRAFKDSSWLRETLFETGRTLASLFFLVIGIYIFVQFLSFSGVPARMAAAVISSGLPATGVMVGLVILYLILGCFIDAIGMMLLTLPIVFPIVIGLGFDPIWFGIVLVILCEIGYVTPPVGLNLFVISSMLPDAPIGKVAAGALPFVLIQLLVVIILFAFPIIALYLPSLMG